MNRLPMLPPALGLAAYAAVAGLEANRLRHVGAWTLWVTCGVLLAGALGLFAQQLWSYLFSQLIFVGTALGYATLAAVVAWEALTDASGAEWAGVRRLVMLVIAVVGLGAAGLSAALAVALGAAWHALTPARSVATWLLSSLVALSGVGLLAWLVGHEYWFGQMRLQNECLSGTARACASLVGEAETFSRAQRQAFARRGCEAGSDGLCTQLVDLLDAGHGGDGAELRALKARCQSGSALVCERLGAKLARIGDAEESRNQLSQACLLDVRRCASAGEAAATAGLRELALDLLDQGCAREDAGSCRALLQQRRSIGETDLAALELKLCLIGDVNDCRSLLRSDMVGVCPRLCEGQTPNRIQSCLHCARYAEETGDLQRAEAWFEQTCGSEVRWGCDELARLRQRRTPTQRVSVPR